MSAAGGADITPEQRRAHEIALLAVVKRAREGKLAEKARRVREVIPPVLLVASTRGRGSSRDAAARRDARGALLDALTVLAPLTRFLDEPEEPAAMDHSIAVLRATGPIDRKALGHSLHTMHERMSAMLEERAQNAASDDIRRAPGAPSLAPRRPCAI